MSRPLSVLERIIELVFCHVQIFAVGRKTMILCAVFEALFIPSMLCGFYFLAGSGRYALCFIMGAVVFLYHFLLARIGTECAFNDGLDYATQKMVPLKASEIEKLISRFPHEEPTKH